MLPSTAEQLLESHRSQLEALLAPSRIADGFVALRQLLTETADASSVIAALLSMERTCWRNVDEIDPDGCQDWHSITLGYCLGQGISAMDSHRVSRFVTDHCRLLAG